MSGYTYTLTGTHPQMNGLLCWEVTDIVHTGTPSYDVSYEGQYDTCSDCTIVSDNFYTGSTFNNACSSNTTTQLWFHGTVHEPSTGVNGTVLYSDSSASTPVPFGYYRLGSETFGVLNTQSYPSVEDGGINFKTSDPCPTPTPTPVPSYEFTVYVSDYDGDSACNGGNAPNNPVYTAFVITGDTTDLCTSNSFSCYFIPT
jgi:hypothetical protein